MPVFTPDYIPQERQKLLHQTAATLIFYGGAVGGGKSHAIRWDLILWCLTVPGVQCYLFRRTLGELEDNHIKAIQQELPDMIGSYNETRKKFTFVNGSAILFCYCEREQDVKRYQGSEIHVLGIDEASHLTETQITYLIGRNRLGGFQKKVPKNLRHALPRAVFGSNPGGPGHDFLKRNFVTVCEPEQLFWNPTFRNKKNAEDKGRLSIFIPARMRDNKYLDENYSGNLAGLPEELRRAYEEGDWDAVVGQALPVERSRHMVRNFSPPRHWTHFMSMDWGTGKPFSVGWYCVSDGAVLRGRDHWPDIYLPAGAVIRYAEMYGWNGKADQGCRKDARTVARDIREREKAANMPAMDYRVADSSMWAQYDGPSAAENMMNEAGFSLRRSKKDRERNYSEILARLSGNPLVRENGKTEEHPMFFVAAGCVHFWRTVPILTLDENDPNKGPDTKLEDHIYDEVAYALRSRPYVSTEDDRWEEEWGQAAREALKQTVDPYATA